MHPLKHGSTKSLFSFPFSELARQHIIIAGLPQFIVCPQSGIESSHEMFSLLQERKQPYFPGTLLMDEFVMSAFEPFSSTTPTDFVPFESACVRPADTAAACQVPDVPAGNLSEILQAQSEVRRISAATLRIIMDLTLSL